MGNIELLYSGIPDLLPQQRGPGLHVTPIIRAIALKYGYVKLSTSPVDPSRLQLGQALEHAVLERMRWDNPDRYIRVGEMERDGIKMNLDFLDTYIYEPWDCKLTDRSSNNDIAGTKFWCEWMQVASYAGALETKSAVLAICHEQGDYSHLKTGPDGRRPLRKVIYNVWRQTWTQDELDDIWVMIINHKHLVEE